MINFLIVTIKFIFLLGFLVLIHEGGHCIVAKLCKVKVHDFAIGFGPIIFEKQIGETKYTLRALPLGGFVRMEGDETSSDDKGSFSKKSIPKRIAIVLAGAIVNIVFGLVVYFILVTSNVTYISNEVNIVEDGYNAKTAGVLPGDKIVKVNNKTIHLKSDLDKELAKSNGNLVNVQIKRNNEYINLSIMPKEEKMENTGSSKYLLGIQLAKVEKNFLNNIQYGFWDTVNFSMSILDNTKKLFTGKVSANQLTGPIGISTMVADTNGIVEFIYLLALISLALGVTNLLPIPPLDGWKVLLYLIEAIRKKPLDEKIQINIETLGISFMIILSIYVAYNDILKI